MTPSPLPLSAKTRAQDQAGFSHHLSALEAHVPGEIAECATQADVERALAAPRLDSRGFLALLSRAAEPYLETMARRAHELTVQHFGRVMLLYTPLYLSNHCVNSCRYCGFSAGNRIQRSRLTMDQVEREALLIRASGLRHVLALTGDSRAMSSVGYLAECVSVLRRFFDSVSMEVYALEEGEYARLVAEGADGLTIYQETYDRTLYAGVHPRGPKRDFVYRLEAPDRACRAGMRSVNVGALLGLGEWRRDAFLAGMHADYLQRRHPDVEVGISLPRMRPHEGVFSPLSEVSDREFVQILLATRLFLPRVGISLSTRERADFRDRLIRLGVTRMSGGSCTSVGGRIGTEPDTGQFEISDERDVRSLKRAVESHGYKIVFKDWQPLDCLERERLAAPAAGAVGHVRSPAGEGGTCTSCTG